VSVPRVEIEGKKYPPKIGKHHSRRRGGGAHVRSEVSGPTIPAMVRDAAERFGDAEAVVDGDRRVGFAELSDLVNGAARALVASGLEAGDCAPVWAPNPLAWVIAPLGGTTAGGGVGARHTALPGAGGRVRPRPQPRPHAVHGARLPRHRLSRTARRRGRGAARARAHRAHVR